MAPSFRVERGTDPRDPLRLVGVIDEEADLRFLARITEPTTLSLAGIRRINSYGVRQWIDGLRQTRVRLRFIECPPPLVDQLNMVTGFLGNHELVTFYIPLECTRCGASHDELIRVSEARSPGWKPPAVPCGQCGGSMELEALEDQYLAFLRDGEGP